jgi:hypothetical protein
MGCGASREAVRVGPACLAIDDEDKGKRAEELAAQKKMYNFQCMYPGLMPLMTEIPAAETDAWNKRQQFHFLTFPYTDSGPDFIYQKFIHSFKEDEDGWEKWRTPLSAQTDIGHGLPYIAYEDHNRWATDAEFGWQKMNGIAPYHMRRCTEIPTGFAVTDEQLVDVLPNGVTIASLIEAKRLFISDWTEFEDPVFDREAMDEVCAMAGWCLLWSDDEQVLMPIAIQLKNDPTKSPVFTPKDGNTWLAAKIHCQTTEHNYDATYHNLNHHFVGETIGDSLQRNLHVNHPLHVLLSEHFGHTIGINVNLHKHVMTKDPSDINFSVIHQRRELVVLKNKTYDWNSFLNMDEAFIERGVEDTKILPGNLWRDDTIVLWTAIKEYVAKIVDVFYKTDDDVKQDEELANWIAELQAPLHDKVGEDLPAGCGCGFKGMPVGSDGKMTTIDQVKLFAAQLINNHTVNHNACGQGAYQATSFAPNMPGQFHLPIERMKEAKEKGEEIAQKEIRDALPGLLGIAIAVLSTQVTANEKPTLPCYSTDFFKAEQIKTNLDNFTRRLEEIDLAHKKRNEKLMEENNGRGGHREYRCLLPENLGMSVNI